MPFDPQDWSAIQGLNQQQFPWTGNWRVDSGNLRARGMRPDQAVRIAQEYASGRSRSVLDHVLSPVYAVGEVFQTLQKPFIAGAAGIAQGKGVGEILGDVVTAPFTFDRTFAEVPGMPSWLALGLDVLADPLFIIGGGFKLVGKGGRSLRELRGAALDVATERITTRGGGFAESLSEALLDGSRHADAGTDLGKWKRRVQDAYEDVAGRIERVTGERPLIDDLVAGPKERMVPNEVLARAGLAAPARILGQAPFPEAQAALTNFLDRGPGWMRRLLSLDRDVDFLRRQATVMLAGSTGRQSLSMEAAKELNDKLVEIAKTHDVTIDPDRITQIIETRGLLSAGGRKLWNDGAAELEDLARMNEALRDILNQPGFFKLLGEGRTYRQQFRVLRDVGLEKEDARARLEVLGLLVSKDRRIAAAHREGRLEDVSALKITVQDPTKLGVNPRHFETYAEHARQIEYENLLRTHNFDHRLATAALRKKIEGSISDMTELALGVAKDDPILLLAKAYEDFFFRLGVEEKAAGALAATKKGYVRRAGTPFAGRRAALQDEGLTPLRAIQRSPFREHGGKMSPRASFQAGRSQGERTTLEIEDLVARGKMEFLGGKPSGPEWKNFKQRLDPDGSFFRNAMDPLRRFEGGDEEMTRLFWSNPLMVAAERWQQYSRVINARSFLTSGLRVFSQQVVTKAPRETVRNWGMRISDQLRTLPNNGREYSVILDKRMIDDDTLAQMGDLVEELGKAETKLAAPDLVRVQAEALQAFPIGRGQRGDFKAFVIHNDYANEILARRARFSDPTVHQGFLRAYGSLTSMWKSWALFPRPAYHFRNFISNSWLMTQAGMRPDELAVYYYKAQDLLRSMSGAAYDFKHLARQTEVARRGRVQGLKFHTAKATSRMQRPFAKSDQLGELTREEAARALLNDGVIDTGLMASHVSSDMLRAAAAHPDTPYKLKGKVGAALDTMAYSPDTKLARATQGFARNVEGLGRVALWLWSIEKGGMTTAEASSNVAKFLFNYQDLAQHEKTIQRYIWPFWAWIRNNVPLQLQQLVERPALTTAPFRVASSVEARNKVSADLEPHWIGGELGFPMRTKKGPNGETQVEYRFFGSYMPVRDLASIGIAVASGAMFGAKLASGLVPGALPEWAERLLLTWEQRRGKPGRELISFLGSGMNPIALRPLELTAGVSLFRMREIGSTGGDLVTIPWLGDYATTRESAAVLASIPVLQELDRVFRGQDVLGREIPASERVGRLFTGMPGIFQGQLGGRYEIDANTARARSLRKARADFYAARSALTKRSMRGNITDTQRDELLERMKILLDRRLEIGQGRP